MHVDTFYQTSKYPYPIDTLVPQDSSGPPADPTSGAPIDPRGAHRDYGRSRVSSGTPSSPASTTSCGICSRPPRPASARTSTRPTASHDKCAAQNVGSRGVLAIMDTGRAAAFSLPTASLLNAAGSYIAADAPGMAAAAADYVTDSATGTQSLRGAPPAPPTPATRRRTR